MSKSLSTNLYLGLRFDGWVQRVRLFAGWLRFCCPSTCGRFTLSFRREGVPYVERMTMTFLLLLLLWFVKVGSDRIIGISG